MSQWLVTKGSNQFSVEGLSELKSMASGRQLVPGDLIQPPGATDWIYAVEIPDLKVIFDEHGDDYDDDIVATGPGKGFMMGMATILLGVTLVGGISMFNLFQQLPNGDEQLIGEGGLTYSEMVVTESGISLLSEPDERAKANAAIEKNSILELLAKRGDFYRARNKAGAEGWISEGAVIPMYQLGGADVRDEYDPLYNPDTYVEVANASWQQMPGQDDAEEVITVFQFMVRNESRYNMADIVLLATIKDAKGAELERVEIPVEGVIPAGRATMVGTLQPEEDDEEGERRLLTHFSFGDMVKEDPELQLRYSEGVEVAMKTGDFTNAVIDVLELRAVPDDQAAEIVSSRE